MLRDCGAASNTKVPSTQKQIATSRRAAALPPPEGENNALMLRAYSPPREGETRAKRARGSLTHHLDMGKKRRLSKRKPHAQLELRRIRAFFLRQPLQPSRR